MRAFSGLGLQPRGHLCSPPMVNSTVGTSDALQPSTEYSRCWSVLPFVLFPKDSDLGNFPLALWEQVWPLTSGDESSLAGLYTTLSLGSVSHSCTNAFSDLELLDVQGAGVMAKSFLAGDWLLGLYEQRLLTRLSLLTRSQAGGLAKIVPAGPGSSTRAGGSQGAEGRDEFALQ